MRGLLAAGLDRVVGRLVHAVTSTHRSRTDARDLAVWLDRHRGAGIDGLLPVPGDTPLPATCEPLLNRPWGRAWELTWPSALPAGDPGHPGNDVVRVRLVLPFEASAGLLSRLSSDPRPPGRLGVPVLLMVPGWLTSSHLENEVFLARQVLSTGAGMLLLDTPWHYGRTPAWTWSGVRALTGDLAATARFLQQAVSDAAGAIAWLRAAGATRVGVYGESLGAWITALLAERLADPDMVLAVAPPVRLDRLIDEAPMLAHIRRQVRASRLPDGLEREALDLLSPLRFPLRTAREAVSLVQPRHDRMLPGDGVGELWEHWGRPERLLLEDGHLSFRVSGPFYGHLLTRVRERLTL